MAANYNRTKPVDPLWYRSTRALNATCTCGHRARIRIADWIARGVDPNAHIYQIIPRLRCSKCGKRGPSITPET